MASRNARLAVVTGASSGIGLELARCFKQDGVDLVIASDQAEILEAADELSARGGLCRAVQADLSTSDGVRQLTDALLDLHRPIDAIVANAGIGLGNAFLEQDLEAALDVVKTNIDGTLMLLHTLGRVMASQGQGRILITGSIAGLPGPFEAVYNGTKAFLDSFAVALHEELKGSGVTVTCLMPGATDTHFFERGGMRDTKVGSDKKQSAAEVARIGYEAMMSGEVEVVAGLKNKFQAAMTRFLPDSTLAQLHRGLSEPGQGKRSDVAPEREQGARPRAT